MTILKVQGLKMSHVDIAILLTVGSPVPIHPRLTFQEYNDSSGHSITTKLLMTLYFLSYQWSQIFKNNHSPIIVTEPNPITFPFTLKGKMFLFLSKSTELIPPLLVSCSIFPFSYNSSLFLPTIYL